MDTLEAKVTTELQIVDPSTTSLKVLDAREAELIALAEESKALMINGPDDKEGYKKVSEKRKQLKKARTSVRNDGKSLRDAANRWREAVISREDALVAIIEPHEERLAAQEAEYEEIQEQRRIEESRREAKALQDRIDALAKFHVSMDAYDLKIMPEEDYQALLGESEAEFLKEQERQAALKAEEEHKRKEDEQRLKLEQEQREIALRKEREELDRKQAEQDKRHAEFKAEQARIAAEERARVEEIQKQIAEHDAKFKAEREQFEKEKAEARRQQEIKEAEERARKEEQERIQKEAEWQKEKERLEQEFAARQEAIKPEKLKIRDWANAIIKVANSHPAIVDEKLQDIVEDYSARVYACAESLVASLSEEL